MKFFFGLLLILSLLGDGLKKASRINNSVEEANTFYRAGHYQKAISIYKYLADSLGVKDEQLSLNLAHAQYLATDINKAKKTYLQLVKSKDRNRQSVAFTQLGLIYFKQNNPERALYTLKKALIQNPLNDIARYNFELIQKYLETNPPLSSRQKKGAPKRKDDKSKEENNKQNAAQASLSGNSGMTNGALNSENNTSESKLESNGQNWGAANRNQNEPRPDENSIGDESPSGEPDSEVAGVANKNGKNPSKTNRPESENSQDQDKEMQTLRTQLRDSNLTPEKAKMLLEAMQQSELQYLQQVPKRSNQKQKKQYPDW